MTDDDDSGGDGGLPELTGLGIFLGAVSWLVISFFGSTQADCARNNSCGSGQLFFASIIAVGMLAPAWIVALIASSWGIGTPISQRPEIPDWIKIILFLLFVIFLVGSAFARS